MCVADVCTCVCACVDVVDDVERSSLSSVFVTSSTVRSKVSLNDSRISNDDSDCGVNIFRPSGVNERSEVAEVKDASMLVSIVTFSRSRASCDDLVTSELVRSHAGLPLMTRLTGLSSFRLEVNLRSHRVSARVSVSTDPTIRMSSTMPLVRSSAEVFVFLACSEYSSFRKTGLLNSIFRSDTGVTSDGDFSSDVGLARGFLRAWGFLRPTGGWAGGFGIGWADAFLGLLGDALIGVVSSNAILLLTRPGVSEGGDALLCGGERCGGVVFAAVVVLWWWVLGLLVCGFVARGFGGDAFVASLVAVVTLVVVVGFAVEAVGGSVVVEPVVFIW